MLGAGVDPRMFTQDYSGFANAGMIQGQTMANLGERIGQAAEAYQANKKQATQMNAQVKANENFLSSAKTVFGDMDPGLSQMIDNALAISSDPQMSLLERSQYLGGAVQNLQALMSGVVQKQEMDIRKQQLGLQQQTMNQAGGDEGEYVILP